jgi:hypothetical protein
MEIEAPTTVYSGAEFDINLDWLASKFSSQTTFLAVFGIDLSFLGITVDIVNESVSTTTNMGPVQLPPGPFALEELSPRSCNDISAAGINVGLGSASVGGSVCVTQAPRFEVVAIDGALIASLAGHPDMTFDFRLDDLLAQEAIPVHLPFAGTWEFSFGGFGLESKFGSHLDIEAGVFGELCIILLGCDTERFLGDVADVNSNDFPLTWATASLTDTFFITREVPEPSTWALFRIVLICLTFARRSHVAGARVES